MLLLEIKARDQPQRRLAFLFDYRTKFGAVFGVLCISALFADVRSKEEHLWYPRLSVRHSQDDQSVHLLGSRNDLDRWEI